MDHDLTTSPARPDARPQYAAAAPRSPLRAELKQLPSYRAGRTPADVKGGRPAVKLSSNELAFPPLPSVLERLAAHAPTINRYPRVRPEALAAALADRHGVDAAQVTIGAGSVSLCTLLAQATLRPGDEAIHPAPSFEIYGPATVMAGGTPVAVPLRNHRLDLDAMLAAVTPRTRLVFLCTPNNPTGPAVAHDDAARLLAALPEHLLLVVDEAYREFVTSAGRADGLELLRDDPRVVVLRTFSKAYGLAGLRIGYAVASAEVADVLRRVIVPFSVTTLAEQAALASLEPQAEAELTERVATVVAERTRVLDELAALGVHTVSSDANFVFLPALGDPLTVARAYEDEGVILRALPPHGVRATIGAPDENDRFLEATERILAHRP